MLCSDAMLDTAWAIQELKEGESTQSTQMEDMLLCLIQTVVTHTCYKAGPVWYRGSNMM